MITSERVISVLAGHGELRSQAASDWTGPLRLPSDLARFYREIGPVDVTIADVYRPFFLPALAGLWDFQTACRVQGSAGLVLSAWDEDWLAVADQQGDPFLFSRRTGRISFARPERGAWQPHEIFADLHEMACCLSLLGSLAAELSDEPPSDDEPISPHYRRAAEFGLTDLLGSLDRASNVLSLVGWGVNRLLPEVAARTVDSFHALSLGEALLVTQCARREGA